MTLEVHNSALCAYIDRECRDAEKRRVVAALATSPQLTERIALWRRNDAVLRLALAVEPARGPLQPIAKVETARATPHCARVRKSPSQRLTATAIAAIAGGSGFIALASATLILAAR